MNKTFLGSDLGGGVGNTPLTTKNSIKKRTLWDWISVTVDWLDLGDGVSGVILGTPDFKELLKLLGGGKMLPLTRDVGLNGYRFGYVYGENTRFNFGGLHTMSNEKYTVNLVMSGQACREFDIVNNGSFYDLLSFLYKKSGTVFNRMDLAIDDFTGEEVNIYDLADFVRNGHYVSPLSKFQIIEGGRKVSSKNDLTVSDGFSITLGSKGRTQLQIYDKQLERRANAQHDLDTEVWFRYEMRLYKDKAKESVEKFISSYENDDGQSFLLLASGILKGLFQPKIVGNNRTNFTETKTWEPYLNFLGEVRSIDLKSKPNYESTIERKASWYNRSIISSNAELLLAFDDADFKLFFKSGIYEALYNLDDKKLSKVNNYRTTKGLKALTWEDVENEKKKIYEQLMGIEEMENI
ncbi:MAG: replication initiation factor domain-containing protein [Bacilli bacterium]